MATLAKTKKTAPKKTALKRAAPKTTATRKTVAKKTAARPRRAKGARPPVAIGHVRIETHKVPETIDFFLGIGMRHIFRNDSFAVLELRGGTHLIVSRRDRAVRTGTPAPFDIMVDDVHATHDDYAARGWEPTGITSGTVHSSFHVTVPSGHKLKVTSSHAGDRPV